MATKAASESERPLKRQKGSLEDEEKSNKRSEELAGGQVAPTVSALEGKKKENKEGEEYGEPIARFDYHALGDLARLGDVEGFLVTCAFRREKSATVEAIRLIGEAKRDEGKKNEDDSAEELKLSLVKCHMKGKLFIKFTTRLQPINKILSQILETIANGKCFPPEHCLRFFPVQALCQCEEVGIEKAFQQLLSKQEEGEGGGGNATGIGFGKDEKFTFAVGGKAKAVKLPSGGKVDVVKTLAGIFQGAYKNSVVNLKEPQVVVLYESLHISRNVVKDVLIALSLCHRDQGLVHIRSKGIGVKPLFNRN